MSRTVWFNGWNATFNSVLDWGPNATSIVEYGLVDTQGSGTTTTSATNSTTVTGLTGYTLYDFYVQADCGSNGTIHGQALSLSTCPRSPFLENFDGVPVSCFNKFLLPAGHNLTMMFLTG